MTSKGAGAPAQSPRSRSKKSGSGRKPRKKSRRKKKKGTRGWIYRGVEFFLGAALVALAGLAVLGQLDENVSPWWLVGGLVVAALGSVFLLMILERARRAASPLWRDVLNVAVLVGLGGLAWAVPPIEVLHDLQHLLDSERGTQMRVIRHQVYAAYRRMNLDGQQTILERSRVFDPTIREAAAAFGVSHELLMGIAATESSFHPRPSRDGGRGLFQLTAIPEAARQAAKKALGTDRLDVVNQRHNAFLAAATLTLYAEQMKGDLLLTLLAYNIGPHNGGLRFIVDKYGAKNFAQAQPYLQELPRDYPIRVLSAALAYRLWTAEGALPRYEGDDGEVARRVQRLGVPGLDGPVPFGMSLP